jgi:heme exporter protein B
MANSQVRVRPAIEAPPKRVELAEEEAPRSLGQRFGERLRYGLYPYFRAVAAVVWKDLVAELRSKELVTAMLIFAILVTLSFNFALELRLDRVGLVAAGLVWVTIIFAGMLGLDRSLAMEKDRGCLDGLLLCPVDRSAIYFGKMIGNLLFMTVVQAIFLPLFSVLFNYPLLSPGILLIVVVGTIGLAGIGTLISTMAVHTRAREVMLPIMLLPLLIPFLLAAVKATRGVLDGLPWNEFQGWIQLMVAYNMILLAAAYMTFDYVVEE